MDSLRDPIAVIDIDIRSDLDRVEAALRQGASSDQPLVRDAAVHLIAAGGKRFRPMLTLLSGYLGDPSDPRIVPCAAAIELTHLATLYHDDVIDETTVRRGVPTVNAQFGNSVAVLTGDFLFARASSLAADLHPYVSRRLADTIAVVCEGVIMELEVANSAAVAAARYLDILRRKTASLIATACHLGAWLSGAAVEHVDAVTEYGDALGMAFQLTDDILDIAGDEAASGKTPGTDLRQGVHTLPALYTLDGTVRGAHELTEALAREDIDAALALLRSNGSVELTYEAIELWQGRARDALARLSVGAGRDALERLVSFTSARAT